MPFSTTLSTAGRLFSGVAAFSWAWRATRAGLWMRRGTSYGFSTLSRRDDVRAARRSGTLGNLRASASESRRGR
eukprot:scaffold61839_cov69-Phaeocystis_antarctica.AAC.3